MRFRVLILCTFHLLQFSEFYGLLEEPREQREDEPRGERTICCLSGTQMYAHSSKKHWEGSVEAIHHWGMVSYSLVSAPSSQTTSLCTVVA